MMCMHSITFECLCFVEDESLLINTSGTRYPKSLDASAKDICMRFLNRDPSKRLGADSKGAEGIKSHPFFASIDWDKLAKREIPPPWAPRRSEDKTAAINFDDDFTSEDPTVSPPQVWRYFWALFAQCTSLKATYYGVLSYPRSLGVVYCRTRHILMHHNHHPFPG